jgi:hypothetical protein
MVCQLMENAGALIQRLAVQINGRLNMALSDLEAEELKQAAVMSDAMDRDNTSSSMPREEIKIMAQHYTFAAIETAVAEVWESVLNMKPIGHKEDFLDVGGDSVTAALIAGRLRTLFQVDIPLPYFFEYMTISEMASMIAKSYDSKQES